MRNRVVICAALAAVTLAVFWRAGGGAFINYDDPVYVTNNLHVQGGITWESVRWAFSTMHATNWHPLTWLSHMIDCRLYGLDPRGHHLTSVGIHVANTLLLFLLFDRMTGATWRSAFVAALFALHPLHVESVAWIAERKDVLSAFFWFLTMLLYAGYVRNRTASRYLPVVICFAVGLMAKPMLVTLPCVLLLMDYWPLGRFGRTPVSALLSEKLPLFALAGLSSLVTFYAQRTGGSVLSLDQVSFPVRVANALVAWLAYIGKMIWPARLAVIYPLDPAMPLWPALPAGLALAAVTLVTWRGARRRPYLLTGWLWYLGTLVPVIGLVQVGVQSMADRYTYIPLVGLFVMIAWGVPELAAGWRYRQAALPVAAGTLLGVLSVATWRQLGYWRDDFTLFSRALRVTRNNYVAQNEVGVALARMGIPDEAAAHFRESLRIRPDFPDAHYNWGVALLGEGKLDPAIAQFTEALRYRPDSADGHNNLGIALYQEGKLDEAIAQFTEALRIAPGHASARANLDVCLQAKGAGAPARERTFP
jgi:protein O-mannosyl-transferase